MDEGDGTPYSQQAPARALATLRLRAEQCAREEDDAGLLALAHELRGDDELWPHLWAPACAIAAERLGRAGGFEFLEEAVAAGFSQPELFEGQLEQQFGDDSTWPRIQARMGEAVPPPPVQILSWPDPSPSLPLKLDRIADHRESLLRQQLPDAHPSAWDTARATLEWTRRRWEHANDHVEHPDAVDILGRVDAGERFACVEYSIVLSQALNALHVPARRVQLRQALHHTGVGRGHVVAEAWIDDLDRWVLLDGQNGAYWADATGVPMALPDLQRTHHRGEPPATMVGLVDDIDESSTAQWWTHFASASTTGYTWASPPFSPVFQQTRWISTARLIQSSDHAYPSLSSLSVGLSGAAADPAITLAAVHPYAASFLVRTTGKEIPLPLSEPRWPMDTTPGRHEAELVVVTEYGPARPSSLSYEVRSRGG